MKRRNRGYLDRVLKIGATIPAGQVAIVEVQHDAGCAFWQGRACNCVPTVRRVNERRLIAQ